MTAHHRYGPVAIGALSGAQPVAARTRARFSAHTVKHYVMVHPHRGALATALCGYRATKGWVLDPSGVLEECPRCAKIKEKDS